MILDIDIRVSNDNGVQVQQFTKHFDSRFEGTSGIGSTNNSITKGFEEFLAEFLTSSGRVIRNNLITEQTAVSYTPNTSFNNYSNVEYTLKLGDSQSVTGSIPLDKLFRLSELSKINTNSADLNNNNSSISSNSSNDNIKSASSKDSREQLMLKRTNFKTPVNLSDVDEMFRQFITTAVTRYENSFYVEDIVDSNFAESS
jgi:hypothetical protein